MARLASILVGLAAACSGRAVANEMVWLEAEQFSCHGGWVNDAQFVDQMGSPYLLANGMGQPVEDARTKVHLAAGRYRLWARTKDFCPAHHPGPFQVLLNGKAVAHVFGCSGVSGWRWEDGGVWDLAGDIEIRLHDLTGYYGRCDALVLTTDHAWVPPQEKAAIAALREEHGGLSREIRDLPARDVVVVGGGLAGCTAAVAAARNGATAVLIQNRPLLGGNASTEILVPPVGVSPGAYRSRYPLDPAETGLIEEFRTAGNQKVSEGILYSQRLERLVRLEPNLDLYLNTHATGVETHPGGARISAVLAVDVRSGQRLRFPGTIFIDCTGDAVIGVAAGAEWRHGKESRSMHGEPWAPEVANRETMGNGLKYFARDAGCPQPFQAPAWAYRFPRCQDFGPGRHPQIPDNIEMIGHQWIIELGGTRDTYADAEEIRDALWRLIYGLWDHTKNHCERDRNRAANFRLAWVGHVAGKRESRRLIGDYVLTQNDIGQQTLFPDRVAFGGWIVDDHYSEGFFHRGSFGPHYDDKAHAYQGQAYSIPFRCLYSKNIDNLMMAGRDISASHLALANTRVMLTCAVIGHAAGTGAALCVRHRTTPRGLGQQHIAELQQQLLKEGAHLIGLKNEDPRDLARSARATASSEAAHLGQRLAAGNVINGFARAVGQQLNAWAPSPEQPGPHWVELAWDQPLTFNVVHISFRTVASVPRDFAVEVWDGKAWNQVAEVADNRHRRHVLGLDRQTAAKLRLLMIQPAPVCEVRVYDEPPQRVEIARRAHRNMRLPDQDPVLPWDEARGHGCSQSASRWLRSALLFGHMTPAAGAGV